MKCLLKSLEIGTFSLAFHVYQHQWTCCIDIAWVVPSIAYNKEEFKNSPPATVTEYLKVGLKLQSNGKRPFSDLGVPCISSLLHLTSRSYFTAFGLRDFLTAVLQYIFLMGKLVSPSSRVFSGKSELHCPKSP